MARNAVSESNGAGRLRGRRITYTVLGSLTIVALAALVALGLRGFPSPGLVALSYRSAVLILGGTIGVLAVATIVLFFSLRDTVAMIEERTVGLTAEERAEILEKQNLAIEPDDALVKRLASLERDHWTHADHLDALDEEVDRYADLPPRVATLEAALEDLREREPRAPQASQNDGSGEEALGVVAALDRVEEQPPEEQQEEEEVEAAAVAGETTAAIPLVGDVRAKTEALPLDRTYPLWQVEGIGAGTAPRLYRLGINDTGDLHRAHAESLADALGVHVGVVRRWQQMAELMAVRGIGPQYAEVLVEAGVTGIGDLRGRNAHDLLDQIHATEADRKVRIQGTQLGEQRVEHWIASASEHGGFGSR